mmetsp:Transcript_11018/g.41038  ORF Transcript_11018/g.41038 Transcript_11018/m.41038 type:complete len:247 (-) Transcript_11018:1354-2094(-)
MSSHFLALCLPNIPRANHPPPGLGVANHERLTNRTQKFMCLDSIISIQCNGEMRLANQLAEEIENIETIVVPVHGRTMKMTHDGLNLIQNHDVKIWHLTSGHVIKQVTHAFHLTNESISIVWRLFTFLVQVESESEILEIEVHVADECSASRNHENALSSIFGENLSGSVRFTRTHWTLDDHSVVDQLAEIICVWVAKLVEFLSHWIIFRCILCQDEITRNLQGNRIIGDVFDRTRIVFQLERIDF